MNRIKSIITGFYKGKNLKKQLPLVLIGVFFMAFSMSWLVLVDWGTDTFTNMNLAIAAKLGWSLGNWQILLNILLFIIVITLGADDIGFGTLANMILIGYLLDFFGWLWGIVLPAGMFDSVVVKAVVMLIALPVFVFSAALYMDAGLGSSPCDAIPFIAHRRINKDGRKRIPLRLVRIVYDFTLLVIAFLLSGRIYLVTILMAFTLGPVIEYVGNHIKKWFHLDTE